MSGGGLKGEDVGVLEKREGREEEVSSASNGRDVREDGPGRSLV